jgi:hypothetical protein
MTITKTETVLIPSTNAEGSGSFQYDRSSLIHSGNIVVKWLGGTLSFATVAQYQDFVANVIIPMTNLINSVSGSGGGYAAMTGGTPGSDKVN